MTDMTVEHAMQLADLLYNAGYDARHKERDYDPRGCGAWQDVVDALTAPSPNATTLRAIADSYQGRVESFSSVDALLDEAGITDRYEEIRRALAHEVWAAAQLAPSEGIADGVSRVEVLLRKAAHPAITHCDGCGCDWLDNGLNPVGCPYCKQSADAKILVAERDAQEAENARLREALETMVEMVEMNGFGRAYAMDVARAALEKENKVNG